MTMGVGGEVLREQRAKLRTTVNEETFSRYEEPMSDSETSGRRDCRRLLGQLWENEFEDGQTGRKISEEASGLI